MFNKTTNRFFTLKTNHLGNQQKYIHEFKYRIIQKSIRKIWRTSESFTFQPEICETVNSNLYGFTFDLSCRVLCLYAMYLLLENVLMNPQCCYITWNCHLYDGVAVIILHRPERRVEPTPLGETAVEFPTRLGSRVYYCCYEFIVICGESPCHNRP